MIILASKSFDGSEIPGANGHETWMTYLDQLDWGPGNRDQAAWHAFLRAGSLGIDPDAAAKEVASRIKAAGGTFTPAKLQSQLRRAYARAGREASEMKTLVKPPKVDFSPEKLQRLASAAPDINEGWLAARSPLDPATVTSTQFLQTLYRPGEKVVVFTDFQSQGQCLFEIGASEPTSLPTEGSQGVWFLSNPVDGHFYPNPRQEDKLSRRSEESVTSWRYLVLENDAADSHQWLACLVQLPLKIAAIYTSGGKSIHALVRLDAPSKAHWDAQRDRIKLITVILGADPNAMTAVRLSRLPGTRRGDRPQQLLYLNPEPDGTPIIAASPKQNHG
jgi:hypothetical protein